VAIQWNNDLLTGIQEIDNQHKELFTRINNLLNACSCGKGKDEVVIVFNFLEDYVVKHFKCEENAMLKHNYPDYLAHMSQHQQFISVVKELKCELKKKSVTTEFIIHTNQKVVQWIISHITKIDKKLAEFLRAKSLSFD